MCNLHGTYTENDLALWDLHILHGDFRVKLLCVTSFNRSMYHVPSVPDVTDGADGTCGTFAPSGTWYARVILIKLDYAFVTFGESNAKILLTAELS